MKNKRGNTKVVDGIKNHTASTVGAVHAFSFAIFDVLYIILDRLLRIYLPDIWWGDVLKAIFAGGAYYVIYMIVKAFWSMKIIRENPHLDIAGNWYHVHIPNDFLNSNVFHRASLSAGTTTIKRELNDFTFSSNNYDFTVVNDDHGNAVVQSNNVLRTHWFTETSEVCEGNDIHIVEVYRARSDRQPMIEINECPVCHSQFEKPVRLEEASTYRYGIHKYTVDIDNAVIICDYSDCFPSLKSGKLYLYRSESERDKKIIEYFENHASMRQTV